MICQWAEGVFDFREKLIRGCVRVFRYRVRGGKNEVEESDR